MAILQDGDLLRQSIKHELPPWTVQFDVLKKPAPVPKPRVRAIQAVGNDPCDDVSREVTSHHAPTIATSDRPKLRWGQLGETPEVGTGLAPPEQVVDEATAVKPSKSSLPADYQESWQKWRAMPIFLEEMRQKLERPAQTPGPAAPPSAEAVAFLELLLSGTEPVETFPRTAPAAGEISATTAQIVTAARRMEIQAEAARQRQRAVGTRSAVTPLGVRTGSKAAAAPFVPRAGSAAPIAASSGEPPTGNAGGCRAASGVGWSVESDCGDHSRFGGASGRERDYESRLLERQREHARRLRELEVDAKQEQERLVRQMEQEQAELLERRRAQDEWQQRLQRETEEQKRRAGREAEAHMRAGIASEAAWRTRWWKEQGAKGCGSGINDEKRIPAPPPPAASKSKRPDEQRVLGQLRSKRSESLEDRKREWRALCLQWHPDKCQDKDASTAMFQYLQGLKEWFLAEL